MDNPENSIANVWDLKSIDFGEGQNKKSYRIVMQNHNGPCSFIAICNILILRGEIEISAGETSASSEYLLQLVVEHSRTRCHESMIHYVSMKMLLAQEDVELNPVFTEAKSVRENTLGLVWLLNVLGIKPVHGWLVDPESPEAETVSEVRDHDSAVSLIAKALMESSDKPAEERIKSADTMMNFLRNTQSQLTRYGLSQIESNTEPGGLMALYRNFHLSVLYKRDVSDDPGLYSLVTDQCLLNEPSVVWERVEGITGGGSPSFVDSCFVKSSAVVNVQHIRAEQQLRAEELQVEILREEIKFQEEERAREELRAEARINAEKECLAEIGEWLQKRKEHRANGANQQLAGDSSGAKSKQASLRRTERKMENIRVERFRREFDNTQYRISFHANSGSRQQPRQQIETEYFGDRTEHQLTEYFDRATLDMEDRDITVVRRVSIFHLEAATFHARPRLSQQRRPQTTLQPKTIATPPNVPSQQQRSQATLQIMSTPPNVKAPRPCLIM